MYDKGAGLFLTGFLDRVEEYCIKNDIDYMLENSSHYDLEQRKPFVEGIIFYPEQEALINKAVDAWRGVILGATGMGKSIVGQGIINSFPEANTLFLCHTKAIVSQFADDLKDKGFSSVQLYSSGQELTGKVVVSTIQSFSKMSPETYMDYFDIVLVDECHRAATLEGQYGKVLQHCLAPIKIGLTGTLPEGKEKRMVVEGLLGPVLGMFSVAEATDSGILADAVVDLIVLPKKATINDLRSYKEIYKAGIIHNRDRNKCIIDKAWMNAQDGKSTLIMCQELEHVDILVSMARNRYNMDVPVVSGDTKSSDRKKIKKQLNDKNILCVICTSAWREGVDIKTLDCIVNGCGGKGEIKVMQTIGRATRITANKTEFILVDFLDPYKYLAEHTIKRLSLYKEAGWI